MAAYQFGELFQFIRNGMNVKQDKSGLGVPITRIETISDANVDETRVGYADLDERDCAQWLLEPGDILFSHINSVEHVGKCAVYRGRPEKLVHGMNLLCLRCDGEVLNPEFAKYLIRDTGFRSKLSNFVNKAVNQASVSIGNLRTIPVRVPSLPDQRRIAAILDQAEALRAKRRAALGLLDGLAQAVFLEMFGDPEVNARRWSVTHLQELLSIPLRNGLSPSNDGRVPAKVLTLSAVTGAGFNPSAWKTSTFQSSPPEDQSVHCGDLLRARVNLTRSVQLRTRSNGVVPLPVERVSV